MFWKSITWINHKAHRLRQWNFTTLSEENNSKAFFQEFSSKLNSFYLIKYWYLLQCQWLSRIFSILHSSYLSIPMGSRRAWNVFQVWGFWKQQCVRIMKVRLSFILFYFSFLFSFSLWFTFYFEIGIRVSHDSVLHICHSHKVTQSCITIENSKRF